MPCKQIRIEVRVNTAELAAIRKAARGQPIASFVRSKALARAAGDDVGYELDIIQQLKQVAQSMQDLQTTMQETGIPPTESIWNQIMDTLQNATDKVTIMCD